MGIIATLTRMVFRDDHYAAAVTKGQNLDSLRHSAILKLIEACADLRTLVGDMPVSDTNITTIIALIGKLS
jgi:hypothetical protein